MSGDGARDELSDLRDGEDVLRHLKLLGDGVHPGAKGYA
jgi:hypothetical protein